MSIESTRASNRTFACCLLTPEQLSTDRLSVVASGCDPLLFPVLRESIAQNTKLSGGTPRPKHKDVVGETYILHVGLPPPSASSLCLRLGGDTGARQRAATQSSGSSGGSSSGGGRPTGLAFFTGGSGGSSFHGGLDFLQRARAALATQQPELTLVGVLGGGCGGFGKERARADEALSLANSWAVGAIVRRSPSGLNMISSYVQQSVSRDFAKVQHKSWMAPIFWFGDMEGAARYLRIKSKPSSADSSVWCRSSPTSHRRTSKGFCGGSAIEAKVPANKGSGPARELNQLEPEWLQSMTCEQGLRPGPGADGSSLSRRLPNGGVADGGLAI